MLFKQWSRWTGHDNNQKYLWNKSKTGRGGGSRATPHQSPRAFCMTRSGTGQSTGSSNKGQLWTMRCPVQLPGPVGVKGNRFTLAAMGSVLSARRTAAVRSGCGVARYCCDGTFAPHDSRHRTLTRARRRVTSWLFLIVRLYKGLMSVQCRELFSYPLF